MSGQRSAARPGLYAFLAAAGLVAADQITKILAEGPLVMIGGSLLVLPGFLGLRLVHNTGAAFGILGQAPALLTALAAALTAVLGGLLARGHVRGVTAAGVCLLFSGSLGNLIDRLAHGYVVDFIEMLWIDFPIFNFADCCVTAGCLLTAAGLLLREKAAEGKHDG